MPAPPPHAPPADTGRAARHKRVVRTTVALLFAAWLIDYADRLIINLVLPDIGREFDLSRGEQGLIVSAFFLAYALCQIPGGLLADRFGARRVTLWALLAWSLFTALTGFAWSFAALLLLRFAFGAAEGIFPPASMKALAERTAPAERASANGVVMSSTALAAVLTPLLAVPLLAAFGWRSVFYSTAALGVFVVVAVRLWLPDPAPGSEPGSREAPPRLGEVLRIGVLWRFAAMMFGYSTIIWGLNTWIPSYLEDERGLPITSLGPVLALPGLAAASATVIGGRLSDRFEGHHRKVIVPSMAVVAITLPLAANSASFTGFVAFGTVAIFCASLCYMPIFAVPMRALPSAYVGMGSAVLLLGGQVAGMVAPPVMGMIADALSFEAAFAFLVLGAVIALVMSLLTPQDSDSFRAALGMPLHPSPTTTPEPS
ncbi:MFS transporter [Streptomyces sp. NPDC050418]|uniref:MFS transporter n=1 Tax=Streptomyces sp. NPDC050418 TaxID=3365612 RepID=UPI00379D8713